jgi:hypothetical protein
MPFWRKLTPYEQKEAEHAAVFKKQLELAEEKNRPQKNWNKLLKNSRAKYYNQQKTQKKRQLTKITISRNNAQRFIGNPLLPGPSLNLSPNEINQYVANINAYNIDNLEYYNGEPLNMLTKSKLVNAKKAAARTKKRMNNLRANEWAQAKRLWTEENVHIPSHLTNMYPTKQSYINRFHRLPPDITTKPMLTETNSNSVPNDPNSIMNEPPSSPVSLSSDPLINPGSNSEIDSQSSGINPPKRRVSFPPQTIRNRRIKTRKNQK